MSIHIGAQKGQIADTVLMPGDPLRAKHIAENFLTDITRYTHVRNMYGFTGNYKGKRISVQGAGMGMPSTAIYVHELIHDYEVKKLIRVGTMGSLQENVKLGTVVLAVSACTDSSINRLKFDGLDFAPTADFNLMLNAHQNAVRLDIPLTAGSIFSTDLFYNGSTNRYDIWKKHGVLGLEMESAVLYTLAAENNIKALTLLTVSDHLITGEMMSSQEREKNVNEAALLALETAIS